ncbi:MAG: hypothetical protein IKX14_07255 [Neisseriaceae bacterium]|nr:hypothetical protein [Neisseriaceae bacterium]
MKNQRLSALRWAGMPTLRQFKPFYTAPIGAFGGLESPPYKAPAVLAMTRKK